MTTNSRQEWQVGQSVQIMLPGLYVVATPIGNLRDITLRALDVLAAAERIYCEDTRVTKKLLDAYGLNAELRRCDAHTEADCVSDVVEMIRAGKIVALVSDAGTPGLSDPGAAVVRACHRQKLKVFPVPGAAAAIAAFSAIAPENKVFVFQGFLPTKSAARRQKLQAWQGHEMTLALYEAPQRVADLLQDVQAVFGEVQIAIGRELTKRFESFYFGTPSELLVQIDHDDFKGEVVIMITLNAGTQNLWDDKKIDAALRIAMQTSSLKEAVAQVTARSGQPRKTVYARALVLDRDDAGQD